jgi:hypothetical protein
MVPKGRRSLRDLWSPTTRKGERGFFHDVLVFQNLIFVFTGIGGQRLSVAGQAEFFSNYFSQWTPSGGRYVKQPEFIVAVLIPPWPRERPDGMRMYRRMNSANRFCAHF